MALAEPGRRAADAVAQDPYNAWLRHRVGGEFWHLAAPLYDLLELHGRTAPVLTDGAAGESGSSPGSDRSEAAGLEQPVPLGWRQRNSLNSWQVRYPASCVYVTRFFLRIAYAGSSPRDRERSNCQRVWVALSITNSLACIPWEAPMTLPPADPTDPDLDLMLAGAEELSEEELAGRAEPADGELAGLAEPADEALAELDERLDEEIARLRDPDARADWYADPDDDDAAESAPLFGGGVAEGGA